MLTRGFASALDACDPEARLQGDLLLSVGKEIYRTLGSYKAWSSFAETRGMTPEERADAWAAFGQDPSGPDVVEEWARANGWNGDEPLPIYYPETAWEKLQAQERMDYVMAHLVHPPIAPTGIPALDVALGGGIVAGTFTVIGGEPGSGKTALAAVAAYNMARSGSYKVLVYSAEIGKAEFYDRLLAVHTRATQKDPYSYVFWSSAHSEVDERLGDDEMRRLWVASDEERERARSSYLKEYGAQDVTIRAWMDFSKTVGRRIVVVSDRITCDGICEQVTRLTEAGERVIPIIDHLHAIQPPEGSPDSEYESVTATSSALMHLAKSCRCPMLVLSELRNIGKEERNEPRISWFRGSGHVGYDAGTAIVLMQDGEETQMGRPVAAHVVKNRKGKAGEVVRMMFSGAAQTFIGRDCDAEL